MGFLRQILARLMGRRYHRPGYQRRYYVGGGGLLGLVLGALSLRRYLRGRHAPTA